MKPTAAPAHRCEPSNIKAHPRFIPAKGQPTPAWPDYYVPASSWLPAPYFKDHRTLAEVDRDERYAKATSPP